MNSAQTRLQVVSLLVYVSLVVPILMAATIRYQKVFTFIYRPDQVQNFVPNGTGFFVGVKNEKNPEIVNAYLVMAKHVLERAPDQPYSTIAARRWEVEQLLLNAAHTIYFFFFA